MVRVEKRSYNTTQIPVTSNSLCTKNPVISCYKKNTIIVFSNHAGKFFQDEITFEKKRNIPILQYILKM